MISNTVRESQIEHLEEKKRLLLTHQDLIQENEQLIEKLNRFNRENQEYVSTCAVLKNQIEDKNEYLNKIENILLQNVIPLVIPPLLTAAKSRN